MTIDETKLNEWISQISGDIVHMYWDVQNKLKLDFVPFFIHHYPTIVFVSSVVNIKQSYCSLHDGLLANKVIKDGNLVIVPCKSELKARLMILKVLGALARNKLTFYFFTEECELSNNLSKLQQYGANTCKIVNRHLHNNLKNTFKSNYEKKYQSIYEALLCWSIKNHHPVISKSEYIQLFKSIQHYGPIFNHLIEDSMLVSDKSMKLSKQYGLKEYDEDFTYTIVGTNGKLKNWQKEILGDEIVTTLM